MIDKSAKSILLIGIGNDYRGDDATGLLAIRTIAEATPHRTVELPGEGTELIETWRNENSVIVIDASCSGALVGTITRLDAGATALPKGFFNYSTHAFGLAEAVETSRNLDILPDRLVIYAIEGKVFGQGDTISREVMASTRNVTGQVLAELPPP